MTFKTIRCVLVFAGIAAASTLDVRSQSVARIWNEQNLAAIRIDFPNPAVHSRNLFHISVAMWDAWAAYDETAVGYLHREAATAGDIPAARREAISYAAYRVLVHRYSLSVTAATSLQALADQMAALGYATEVTTTTGSSPVAVGNRVAAAVLAFASSDQSNELFNYADPTYFPDNAPLILEFAGATLANPNRWQPLAFEIRITQNGIMANKVQTFVASQWGAVRPFAMSLREGEEVYFNPGPPPLLGAATDSAFRDGSITVIRHSSLLDPTNGDMIDISPAGRGDNTLGQNDGNGRPMNPVTGMPYVSQVVPHGDYGRVVAEFWADGPDSETPPGHWNTLANTVADDPQFERRFKGAGPQLDELEWDVKVYFALNASVHDVAIAAWGCKRFYDYVRPISSIRYMGGKGQSSIAGFPSYDSNGLPLVSGLIETVTAQSAAAGQKHEGLTIGDIAILAWGGEPQNPGTEFTGVKWIRAIDWFPYQRNTFVTPAFAGYISGHSGFSRAAAEVLTRMTGSQYFPGGMGSFTAPMNQFLQFEQGPSVEVTLQWATYYDASDEAGISRIYGGIHVPADDGPARIVGSLCGIDAFDLAEKYFDGSILNEQPAVAITSDGMGGFNIEWNSLRGLFYELQSSDTVAGVYSGAGATRAGETSMQSMETPGGDAARFYRVRQSGAAAK